MCSSENSVPLQREHERGGEGDVQLCNCCSIPPGLDHDMTRQAANYNHTSQQQDITAAPLQFVDIVKQYNNHRDIWYLLLVIRDSVTLQNRYVRYRVPGIMRTQTRSLSGRSVTTHLGSALTTKRSSSGLYRRVSLTMAYSWRRHTTNTPTPQEIHRAEIMAGLSTFWGRRCIVRL